MIIIKVIKFTLNILLSLTLIFILFFSMLYGYAKIYEKPVLNTANTINLYDTFGDFVTRTNTSDDWIKLNDIDEDIVNALIATEDKYFYTHNGFDFLRLIKEASTNIFDLKNASGTSTITQQYARSLYLNNSRKWSRKLKEAWYAIRIESHYSKNEILEGYLNTVYFGHGINGIENACQFYYDKSARDVTLYEASLLIGILSSPNNYSPLINSEASKKRQTYVLSSMLNNEYISQEEYDFRKNIQIVPYKEISSRNDEDESTDISLQNNLIVIHGKKDPLDLSTLLFFQDAVMRELNSLSSIPKNLIDSGGINIYTTLNTEHQRILEESINSNIRDDLQAAAIVINPNTNEISALIGGVDYKKNQFNIALDGLRQVGSTMKPILYLSALENGFTSSTTFISEATSFVLDTGETYSVQNYNNKYLNSEISLAEAIALSDNIYAVKTHIFLGPETLVETAHRLGIYSNLEANASLPLGTDEISPIEMATAYSVFANGGYKVEPYFIKKVTNLDGEILYERSQKDKIQILNKSNVFILNDLLTGIFDPRMSSYSTATGYSISHKLSRKYAGKSGMTDFDAWMIGYNPNLLTTVWLGYESGKELAGGESRMVKNIWADTMEGILKDTDEVWYEPPSNVVGILVDPVTGKLATENTRNSKFLYYIKGTEPEGEIIFDNRILDQILNINE